MVHLPRRPRLYWSLCAVAVALVLGAETLAWGQPQDAPRDSRDRQQQSFVGKPMPDISVYDASGNPLNLTDLKGSYSVLVFGCLT
ncbi:MAG: hypothetical protein QGI83_24025 [Candidatus Latescibacteria bacterium]|nr:hypothetical protein [Candidatus Latescibacterota bacterium]